MSNRLARIPGARIGVRYLLTSLGFWVLFNGGTFLWHQRFQAFYFREPAILGLTHLAAIGWLTTGLMGIMYATLPATLGVRPNSLRMACAQYWFQVVGIVGLVLTMSLVPYTEEAHSYINRARVVFGLLTLVALVTFAHNTASTVGRGKEWRLPEFHFIMALFYLAITGLIGMSYVFYLNSGFTPPTMAYLKVHAHFAGLGWLALTLMGLTYKLLPLEVGVESAPQRWGLAASVLINLVLWGLFFGFSYGSPALMMGSALLGLIGLVCHSLQVHAIVHLTPPFPLPLDGGGQGRGDSIVTRGMKKRYSSLPYTLASCAFGLVAGLLGVLLTAGAVGTDVAVEYAYAYAAGAGWFGLYFTGQMTWLMPVLLQPDAARESLFEPGWVNLEFPGQVAGTALVTVGLLVGISLLVALGAAVNLAASLLGTLRTVRLCWAQPAVVER
ncbi:MAG: hypothetical protein HYZ81_21285 [Nitrospinae bacterium]|nr:hypothetical protein [Nitrospinota bacterium]